MSETGVRRFEYAADGSELSELICETLLAPMADALAGDDFRDGPVMRVEQEKSAAFMDETMTTLGFIAMKTDFRTADQKFTVLYNAYLVFMRPRHSFEHWPDAENLPDELKDDNSDDDADRLGALSLVDSAMKDDDEPTAREDNDDDDDWGVSDDMDEDYVREVWEYVIDDADYEPRRDVSYEYYQDEVHIRTLSINGDPHQMSMLSDDIDEDIVLCDKDASFARTYSDFDIEMLEAILTFDTAKVRGILNSLGAGYPLRDPYAEAYLADETDETDGGGE